MIYIQRIYDSSQDAFVYYSLGEITTEPDSGDTSPNHGGVQYLVAETHVILQKISEGELTIENNGTTIATLVTNINFTGDVAVVDQGGSVTVDIVGGSAVTFDVASFTKDQPSSALTFRRGASVSGIEAAVSYISGPPTAASIVNTFAGSTDGDDVDPGSWTISSPFTRGTLAGTVLRVGADLGADPTMLATITATKGASHKTESFTMIWTRDVYYGVGAAGLSTEADIENLTAILSGTRARTITISPSDEKVYYAYPKAYGTATFTLGSFPFDMASPFELYLVNVNGVGSTYYVYESTNLLTGSNLNIVIT